MASGPSTHRPALDGLRGVAVVGVLLFHTGHLPGGFLGVDLFFVLSGYLITGLLLREIDATGRVSLVAFWGRRCRRLVPALVTVLVAVTAVVRVVGPPDLVATTLSDGPWVQLNLVNWHLIAESAGYWDRFGSVRVFEHLWSIAVEEQFYLLWPVLVWGVARSGLRTHRTVATVALAVSVASAVLMAVLVDPVDPTRVYVGTDTRAFSLLSGAVAAVPAVRTAVLRAAGRRAGPISVVLVATVGALWGLADGVDSGWLFTGGLFAHSVASALLITLCAERRTVTATVLAHPVPRWFGLLSYSLYLWHWPVVVLLSPQVTGLTGWSWTALVSAVSIGLAAATRHLVEDRIRFRARWARGRSGLLGLVVAMLGLAALWLLLPGPTPTVIDVSRL